MCIYSLRSLRKHSLNSWLVVPPSGTEILSIHLWTNVNEFLLLVRYLELHNGFSMGMISKMRSSQSSKTWVSRILVNDILRAFPSVYCTKAKFWGVKWGRGGEREKVLQDCLRVNSSLSLTFSYNCYLCTSTMPVDSRRGYKFSKWIWSHQDWPWKDRDDHWTGSVIWWHWFPLSSLTWHLWALFLFSPLTQVYTESHSYVPLSKTEARESLVNTKVAKRREKREREQGVWMTKGRFLSFNLVNVNLGAPAYPL